MFSIDGLVSGLNTESIIEGLVSLQTRKVATFNSRKSNIQFKQQALQGVEARLLSFRTKLASLNRTAGGVFGARQAESSNESIVTATSTNQAIEGTYQLRVVSLAAAHQVGSNGFSSSNEAITSGTISFQVGNRPAATITIDNSNNTVGGLVQAINSNSTDVTASIVNDQGSGTNRIVLTSRHTGEENEITIVNNLAPSGTATRPDFSGEAIQAATNAVIRLGSGPGAITTEYATNRVEGLIEGVSLNLKSFDANQDVRITVSRDNEQATAAVKEFVEEYNSLVTFINDQSRFNSETNVGGPLLGNRGVADLKNQLAAMVTESVPGLSSGLNRLSQLGITIDGSGKLSLNSSKLDKALSGEIEGVTSKDLAKLFGLGGTSSNNGIEFFSGSTRTGATGQAIQVDILQAAEQANVIATSALAGEPIVINSSNNQFRLNVDGVETELLTLREGSYTPADLARHLESVINGSTSLGNRKVAVAIDGGRLKVTSDSYGSASKVSNFQGSAISTLGFSGTENGIGRDVAGSFLVNGVVETAVGTGRILVGNSENANTADLQIRVNLTGNQISAGIDGELTITRGAASRLDKILGDFLDSQNGTLANLNGSFDKQLESINQSIDRVNEIAESKREFLVRQFATLERTLNSLQTTASIVSSQLSSIRS